MRPSEELARDAQEGDYDALNQLLSRHKHEAYRVALRIVGKPHDAEEVLQNALERVLKHLRRYDPNRAFRPWLFGIVINQARSYWRVRKLKAFVLGSRAEPRVSADPVAELGRKQLRDVLGEALTSLPVEQREAFVLKHIEGMSYDEMAEITGESAGALRVRVHRARRALLDWCRARGVTLCAGEE